MTRTNKPGREQRWVEAQRRCRLSDEAVRMAKELGLSPRSLTKNIPSPKQQWKAPVEDWVRDIYQRRDGAKPRPGKATDRSEDESEARTPCDPSPSLAAGMPVPRPRERIVIGEEHLLGSGPVARTEHPRTEGKVTKADTTDRGPTR